MFEVLDEALAPDEEAPIDDEAPALSRDGATVAARRLPVLVGTDTGPGEVGAGAGTKGVEESDIISKETREENTPVVSGSGSGCCRGYLQVFILMDDVQVVHLGETSTVRLAKAEKYEYTLVIILNASPCKGGIGVRFSDKRERFALRRCWEEI